jgi:cell division protein FtsW
MRRRNTSRIDTPLLILIAILLVGGSLIFASAAFGLLARGATNMSSVVFSHLVLGIGAGLVALIAAISLDYHYFRQYAPYIYGVALFITALVFIPHVGVCMKGGCRWVNIGGFSLQPSELLKIATIIMASSYFAAMRSEITSWKYGLGGFLGILAGPVILLILQPDLGTLGVICFSVLAIYWAAGARVRDLAVVAAIGVLALGALVVFRPYVRDRVMTFMHPAQGQQVESYQLKQSLIAIGSGRLLGRGFGQGIQKFTYLPEPMGDSIFAVASEELGFVGAVTIVMLFLFFALRGLIVSTKITEPFPAFITIGISTYLACEAFINIASMLGVAPLTGIPLTFISQGGSAMLFSLASAGILLNVSRCRVLNR